MSALDGMPQTFVIRKGDQERHRNAVSALAVWEARHDVEVTLMPYVPAHSDAQRNLFWAWAGLVAKQLREAGMPCCEEGVHDAVLIHIFGAEDMGCGRTRPKRSMTRPNRAGKVLMMEIISNFEAWAAQEFGIMLPRPDSWDIDMAEAARLREKPQKRELKNAAQPHGD